MPEAGTQQVGNNGGSGAPPNNGAGGDPFYHSYKDKLKPETLSWLDGKKFNSLEAALDNGALSDRMARDRNVVAKPDLAKLGEWEGLGLFGYDADAAKYGAKIKPPKQPNDAPHDAALYDTLVKAAHKRFIPPAMAEGLMQDLSDAVNARLSERQSAGIKADKAFKDTLRNDWGAQNFDLNFENAQRAAKALGIGVDDASELATFFGDSADGEPKGSVRLFKNLARIGALLSEGKIVNADGLSENVGAQTPAAAEAELRRLESDAEFLKAFKDNTHPQHEDYKAKWQRLADIAAKKSPEAPRGGRR